MDTGEFGKKVFFVYPHSVFEEHLLMDLIRAEFEIYLVKDHTRFLAVLPRFRSSLVFFNIEEALKEPEWEKILTEIKSNALTSTVGMGILTYNENPVLAQKYLMEIGLNCGYITLKLGLDKSREILIKTLEANEARGRRKYVRIFCAPGSAVFNLMFYGQMLHGQVLNLSSVGMAIQFEGILELPEGSKLSDIQIMLRGLRLIVHGVVVLKRSPEGEKPIYVLVFDLARLGADKEKIFIYIFKSLQKDGEKLLS